MKVLVIGSGGREHAICWKFSQSTKVNKVFVSPGNDGMADVAEPVDLSGDNEIIKIVEFCKSNKINLVFIGQEKYLVDGLVDALSKEKIPVIGPTQAAAQLEGSKVFAKEFMKRHKIPTADFGCFSDHSKALQFLDTLKAPFVIKADGLAAGKGVLICNSHQEGIEALKQLMLTKSFGIAGETVVIEEFLVGEEASYFILSDGKNFVAFDSLQDHKPIGEGNTGPNTGGMGAYSPAPIVTDLIEQKIITQVVKPTLAGMVKEGNPYTGILYIGLMIDGDQINVVEYNCRFGDPECQPLMMRLKSDLYELSIAAVAKKLNKVELEFSKQSATCVMLVSKGYPSSYPKGKIIKGLDEPSQNSEISKDTAFKVFHSATILRNSNKSKNKHYVTNGGRVLGVCALGDSLDQSIENAYTKVNTISFSGMFYRRDIGIKGLLNQSNSTKKPFVLLIAGSSKAMRYLRRLRVSLEDFGIHTVLVKFRKQDFKLPLISNSADLMVVVQKSLKKPLLLDLHSSTGYIRLNDQTEQQQQEVSNQVVRLLGQKHPYLKGLLKKAYLN